MKLVSPRLISQIDDFARRALSLSEETLIRRAGCAVADALFAEGQYMENETYAKTVILCGGGNNGADGYAAALSLAERGVPVLALDVFGKGQRSEGGKAVLQEYIEKIGQPLSLDQLPALAEAGIFVDAMLGTGLSGDLPEAGRIASRFMNRQDAYRLAVDIPFGVNAEDGRVDPDALSAHATVVLSYMKKGLLSYPAREKCGKLLSADIGLDIPSVHEAFPELEDGISDELARSLLPRRFANSHKGNYGRVVLFGGSAKYRGAACLASFGALRAGVGLLTLVSEKEVILSMGKKLPEAIYHQMPAMSEWGEAEMTEALSLADGADAVLVGPGCGKSETLYRLIGLLLAKEGAPLVLDADALGVLALHADEAEQMLRSARRAVLMTPHPLELARMLGISVGEIQADRMRVAGEAARRFGSAVLLKGAGSIAADAEGLRINTTGSSALSKGGSGDVLAGVVTAFAASGMKASDALLLAAYLHGKAGDSLAEELSEYGVLPSELPKQIAIEIAKIVNK